MLQPRAGFAQETDALRPGLDLFAGVRRGWFVGGLDLSYARLTSRKAQVSVDGHRTVEVETFTDFVRLAPVIRFGPQVRRVHVFGELIAGLNIFSTATRCGAGFRNYTWPTRMAANQPGCQMPAVSTWPCWRPNAHG